MPNFRLVLCYDGSRYNGWQRRGLFRQSDPGDEL